MLPSRTSKLIRAQRLNGRFHIFSLQLGGVDYLVIGLETPSPEKALRLTPAEHVVLSHLIKGEPRARIARTHGKSERTVDHQIERIYRKFGTRSRSELLFAIYTGRAEAVAR